MIVHVYELYERVLFGLREGYKKVDSYIGLVSDRQEVELLDETL